MLREFAEKCPDQVPFIYQSPPTASHKWVMVTVCEKVTNETFIPSTDGPKQTINSKLCDGTILIGYGKRGHGMNGKDADLDRVGQCLVTSLETVDPIGGKDMRVDINLRLYASVCAPSGESFNFEALRENASPELRDYFKGEGVDIDKLEQEIEDDTPEANEKLDIVVEYFREQAGLIAEGADPCPGDCMAFIWNDNCWDGGTDITLSVPLTLEEYEAIEEGDAEVLDTVAKRIYTEIIGANNGGTPERDKMKRFEEEVGIWNDSINALECYTQPVKTK